MLMPPHLRNAMRLTRRYGLCSTSNSPLRLTPPTSEFRRGTDEIVEGLNSDNPRIRHTAIEVTTELLLSLRPLRLATIMSRAAIKRAFDLYTFATMTGGASWLTVAQLVYRESWDAQKVNDDRTCRPLLDLDAKVAAVLSACRQTNTITKDGLVLGPVAPFVNWTLGRDR